jgi:hypothetical protein
LENMPRVHTLQISVKFQRAFGAFASKTAGLPCKIAACPVKSEVHWAAHNSWFACAAGTATCLSKVECIGQHDSLLWRRQIAKFFSCCQGMVCVLARNEAWLQLVPVATMIGASSQGLCGYWPIPTMIVASLQSTPVCA